MQVPCPDEATALPAAIAALPRSITLVARVEILVVNGGSTEAAER